VPLVAQESSAWGVSANPECVIILLNKIESIYRYPIKGFSGERLESAILSAYEVLPGDREYAFARAGVLFDPLHPAYLKKTNFLALVRDQKLAEYEIKLNQETKVLSAFKKGVLKLEANLNDTNECEVAAEFFRVQLGIEADQPPRIVRANGPNASHSFSDVPDKVISLISLNSIKEFGGKIGVDIDPMRFRGNINFEGSFGAAWQEFDWIDRDLRIGNCILRVLKRTQRCAATMVNPTTANRDLNVPKELLNSYGHMDMGIYTTVVQGGEINDGDEINLI
jgi:uncharacterized protein YcbX